MSEALQFRAIARGIIEANAYMVLGTADESGRPWVTPVYYASADYRAFYWISSPDTRHSRNVAVRPHISLVIFNSQVPLNTGQAVYMTAMAQALEDADLDQGLEIYSRSAVAHGGRAFAVDEVSPQAPYRLYQAVASEHWILDPVPDRPGDNRIAVTV